MSLLRELRSEHNMTQRELAEKLGVGRSTITAIEIGQNHLTISMAKRIAKILNIDWKIFFEN